MSSLAYCVECWATVAGTCCADSVAVTGTARIPSATSPLAVLQLMFIAIIPQALTTSKAIWRARQVYTLYPPLPGSSVTMTNGIGDCMPVSANLSLRLSRTGLSPHLGPTGAANAASRFYTKTVGTRRHQAKANCQGVIHCPCQKLSLPSPPRFNNALQWPV